MFKGRAASRRYISCEDCDEALDLYSLCCVCVWRSERAADWQPSPGHTQVLIWPGTVPDPQPVAGPEIATTSGRVTNVTRHTTLEMTAVCGGPSFDAAWIFC